MVYICADANFFVEAAARKKNLTVSEYNELIITNWNEVVTNNDMVILLGQIGDCNFEEMKGILSKLNNKEVKCLDFQQSRTNPQLSKEDWHKLGVKTFTYNSIVTGEVESILQKIYILGWLDEEVMSIFYCAAAGSLIESDKLLKEKILNLSIEHWGYMPIRYNDIPKLLNSVIIFSEDKEEKS